MRKISILGLFAGCVLAMTGILLLAQVPDEQHRVVRNGAATLQVTVQGRGTPVVFIPSLGRGVQDFKDLSRRLAKSGYQAILPEPRGIGSSEGPLSGITLHDLDSDVAAIIRDSGGGPTIVVGHAFGNRVARVVATDYPRLVKQLVLLASGGDVPMSEKVAKAFGRVFDPTLPKDERLDAIQLAFFASGHDPKVWEDGWYFDVAKAQVAANVATPVKEWWAGGSAPILVLQATEDVIAVPENSEKMAKEFPDRVRVIQIPGAGHAMLPEQPDLIASAILGNIH
jgi:pimeloyl-ACP methyl ester carboxylesterase